MFEKTNTLGTTCDARNHIPLLIENAFDQAIDARQNESR